MLRQPITDTLASAERILIAGCGGGYDVFGGVPLLAELEAAGKQVHLASLSFAYLNGLDEAKQDLDVPNLYEVTAASATPTKYCPEAYLAGFLEERLGRPRRVFCFEKTGTVQLERAYRELARRLELDAVLLVDGGVDAMLRGDESSLGTPSEDMASLAAVHALDVPVKVLACVGLGGEIRDGICHEQVFARIAELSRAGGFLGASALPAGTPAGELYRAAVEYVFERQASQRRSHIHKIVSAAQAGAYGQEGPHVWLSPLLSVFWFFDAGAVARTNLLLPHLAGTTDIWQVGAAIEAARKDLPLRERTAIPI